MFPKRSIQHHPRLLKQQGSMLVIALFVIIVLAFLGLAIVQISSDSSRSMVYEVYGARAFNAANSGVERALNEVLGPGVTPSCSLATPSYNMPDITGFSGCSINLTCNEFSVVETGYTHFRITSEASCSAGEFVVQRSVAVDARHK
ncbi:type II secretory pathway protein [Psychrobium sp. 1_MG-2023]|uniref:pilus assembly PilX family protein n=1 Tax=Psychrobium sp. 1_MG-2023 TaxID=3062624 RepID=UPI001290A27E|nr:type II secretory pathway protein [Psychrobium sp. 1_MG-2023]MDP2560723.1 type II secretory pathway protein [Psychrobium sp. 1_MG-2023]